MGVRRPRLCAQDAEQVTEGSSCCGAAGTPLALGGDGCSLPTPSRSGAGTSVAREDDVNGGWTCPSAAARPCRPWPGSPNSRISRVVSTTSRTLTTGKMSTSMSAWARSMAGHLCCHRSCTVFVVGQGPRTRPDRLAGLFGGQPIPLSPSSSASGRGRQGAKVPGSSHRELSSHRMKTDSPGASSRSSHDRITQPAPSGFRVVVIPVQRGAGDRSPLAGGLPPLGVQLCAAKCDQVAGRSERGR